MPKLCVMPGDGIGQEVIPVAVDVLQAVVAELDIVEAEAGWGCFERHGVSVPAQTLDTIRACGAGLFGAVQSPLYKVDGYRSAILTMRQELDLFANIRPIIPLPPITPRDDINLLVVRENSEGLYSGRERSDGKTAIAERVVTRGASSRLAQKTLELMRQSRRQRLTIVHKANVLPLTDGLFRDTVREVFADAEFEVDELLVDVAALKMVGQPDFFDVLITTNLFGDILSDAAAHWAGGLGFAPSLNWGDQVAVAEPVHGSAPDIAGQNLANPIAAVLSGALLVRHVWQLADEADAIERAVREVVSAEMPQTTTAIRRAILDQL